MLLINLNVQAVKKVTTLQLALWQENLSASCAWILWTTAKRATLLNVLAVTVHI